MPDNQLLLSYTQAILSEMRISSRIIQYPFLWEAQFDHELRRSIYTEADYRTFCKNISADCMDIYQKHILGRGTDRFGCEYIFVRLPQETPALFVVGPFTYVPFTMTRVDEYCRKAGLPEHFQDFMQQYYVSLPVIPEEHGMESLIGNLAQFLWGEEKLSMPHLILNTHQAGFSDHTDMIPKPTPSSIVYMESKYESEERLCAYIMEGNLEKIEEIREKLSLSSIKQHFPDSLRDQKNNLIMFNTICRKAAQSGGVHPVYVDTEVNRITALIEYAVNIKQLDSIYKDIPRKYCMLVRTYSMEDYSPTIKKIVTHIRLNPDTDLTLKAIAEKFSMNKNYLSTLFKKETGTSLTAFVNQERLNYAIRLLNLTQLPVGEIAKMCGIDDMNYFSRLFKQHVGTSPSSYRNNLKKA